MLLSLAAIMLHQSFDWTCRKNKSSLVNNMASVVKGITGLLEVDINPSSPLYEVLRPGEIEEKLEAWKGEIS